MNWITFDLCEGTLVFDYLAKKRGTGNFIE